MPCTVAFLHLSQFITASPFGDAGLLQFSAASQTMAAELQTEQEESAPEQCIYSRNNLPHKHPTLTLKP